MTRYAVLIIAVALGIAAMAGEIAIRLPPANPPQGNAPARENEDLIIFQGCLTFYAVVYLTGRVLYRWTGAHDDEETLRSWSRWHLLVLNLAAGLWMTLVGLLALRKNVWIPSLAIGLILLGMAAYDLLAAWHSPTASGRENH